MCVLKKKKISKTKIQPSPSPDSMGMALCAESKVGGTAASEKGSSGGKGNVADGEYFTSLAASTTLQLGSRNKFVNDIPSTLLQVATDKANTSRASDGTLPFLQASLKSVRDLGLDAERAGALASYMTLMEPKNGEAFIKSGEEVKGLYVVEVGSVTLPDGSQVGIGGTFGASSLFKIVTAEGEHVASSSLTESDAASLAAASSTTAEGETKTKPKTSSTASGGGGGGGDGGSGGGGGGGGIRIWAIHRLMYQAVSIEIAKTSTKKSQAAIDQIPFFAPLPAASKQVISRALQNGYRKYKSGTKIISQGDAAKSMFFIISGEVVVYQKSRGDAEPKEVNRHGPGKFFGESAIKSDTGEQSTRNADVVVGKKTEFVECYELQRDVFLKSCGSLSELALRQGKARLLKGVDLLSSLSEDEHTEIASMLKMHTFKKSEHIIKQGDMGDEFYIIDSGEVEFFRLVEGESAQKSIGRCFQNQWFGEGSLIEAAPRRASAIASSDTVVCFSLSGAEYRALFGDQIKKQMAETLAIRKAADQPGNSSEIRAQDLSGLRMLGQGSYGKVTLVRHNQTGKTYALKQITRAKVEKMEQQFHVQSEKLLMENVNHPFVCNLVRTFKNQHSVYMLMEPVLGGELYRHLVKTGKFAPGPAQFYLAQVCLVFEHLHSKNVIYRDLKPENILITQDGYLKVVDFGLAKQCEGRTYTLCGTPAYASPEVYQVVGHDKGVDWWTFGILMHELLAGYTPFVGNEPNQIFGEITRYSKHYPNVLFPSHFPQEGKDLLKELLHPKPSLVSVQ